MAFYVYIRASSSHIGRSRNLCAEPTARSAQPRGCRMHCVLWSYPAPAGLTKARADELFAQTAQIYVGVPGLVRKYFGYSDDGATIVGVYLWRSKADADAFYSPEWIAGVTSRWGAMPAKSEWHVPQVVESAEGRAIREEAAPRAAAE
jgi:hypothetical protein